MHFRLYKPEHFRLKLSVRVQRPTEEPRRRGKASLPEEGHASAAQRRRRFIQSHFLRSSHYIPKYVAALKDEKLFRVETVLKESCFKPPLVFKEAFSENKPFRNYASSLRPRFCLHQQVVDPFVSYIGRTLLTTFSEALSNSTSGPGRRSELKAKIRSELTAILKENG
ncbi:hypothetical protein EVAR_24570_1 [Eumeta japonica]|uniref:Uncharacterized protein n=1 Tax=Eumeta variegata TaxID=151549 RepID=A0A4C1W585_EUMVA|nr:hypothetical protein EVAR_24570_1 [Eumeta japonica]